MLIFFVSFCLFVVINNNISRQQPRPWKICFKKLLSSLIWITRYDRKRTIAVNIWFPKLPITSGTAPLMVAVPIIKCLSLVYFSITFTMEKARGPCRAMAVRGTIKTNYTLCCHHCQLCFWRQRTWEVCA